MTLDQHTGGIISEAKARELIANFKIRFPDEVVSSFIGSANVNAILEQENCIGLRIYNGYDTVGKKISLVMVGVDQSDNDILVNGIIYDELVTCPPYCSTGKTL